MLGIILSEKAIEIATSKELDLVKITPNATPPVCKIMNYEKFIFTQIKKEKQNQKNKKTILIKEIKITPNIQEHDLNFKIKDILTFLEKGNRVKTSVNFKGRELQHVSKGNEILIKISQLIINVGNVDKQLKLEGKNMTMILNPK